MLKKTKNGVQRKSVRVWLAWQNAKGGALIENKVLMILAIVVIFGIGALLIPWLKSYWEETSSAIREGGSIDGNFGKSVSF